MDVLPECEQFATNAARYGWCRGERGDEGKSNRWRRRHGLPPIGGNVPTPSPDHKENPPAAKPAWDVSQPSRGLGDDIAKVMHATGMATVVNAVTKAAGIKDCGCGKRQAAMNQAVPYKGKP